MLRSNSNTLGSLWSQSWRRKGYGKKDLRKRKVLSLEWNSGEVMDDESGESIEVEVPDIIGRDELESERLVRGWRREAGSWFQRRGATQLILSGFTNTPRRFLFSFSANSASCGLRATRRRGYYLHSGPVTSQ